MSVIFKSDGLELRLTFWGYASRSAKRPSPAAAAPVLRNERRPIAFSFVDIYSPFHHQNRLAFGNGPFYPNLNFEADARPPGGSFLALKLGGERLRAAAARHGRSRTRRSHEKRWNRWTTSPAGSRRSAWNSAPVQAVLSRGKAERWPAAGWGGGRQPGERDPQAVRSGRATVPSGASASRDSCLAGTRPAAESATGPDFGQIRSELTSAEIAMSGSYFDDVLRDPRRYGIENTTDKVCGPDAVRRRRDVVWHGAHCQLSGSNPHDRVDF